MGGQGLFYHLQTPRASGSFNRADLPLPSPARPAIAARQWGRTQGGPMSGLEHKLESGEVVYFPQAPFALPDGDDRAFLLGQQLGKLAHKNISYNPHTDAVAGYGRGAAQPDRLRGILRAFSEAVAAWVGEVLPGYAGGCARDRVSFRPEEEATRRLRLNARNDLLHVDAFPGRPARGRRILRAFANINPTDPRVWVTSDPLPALVTRYRGEVEGRPSLRELGVKLLELFKKPEARRAPSDWFMLRLHDHLKRDRRFQARGHKKLWHFPPGSAWLAMTDACSHAVLRGRYALEQSFFVSEAVLARPELAPEALLRAA